MASAPHQHAPDIQAGLQPQHAQPVCEGPGDVEQAPRFPAPGPKRIQCSSWVRGQPSAGTAEQSAPHHRDSCWCGGNEVIELHSWCLLYGCSLTMTPGQAEDVQQPPSSAAPCPQCLQYSRWVRPSISIGAQWQTGYSSAAVHTHADLKTLSALCWGASRPTSGVLHACGPSWACQAGLIAAAGPAWERREAEHLRPLLTLLCTVSWAPPLQDVMTRCCCATAWTRVGTVACVCSSSRPLTPAQVECLSRGTGP